MTSSRSQRTQPKMTVMRDAAVGTHDASNTEPEATKTKHHQAQTRNYHSSFVTQTLASYRRRRKGGASSSDSSSDATDDHGLLGDAELEDFETTYADGITAVQVVEIFTGRGIRFSEASFRKYVQLGLLPRSRRIGRKGKHRGSLGMYPVKTVRRVNEIKRLMAEGYTIEEIQAQFLRFTNVLESLEEGVSELFSRFEEEIGGPRFDSQTRRSLDRELADTREAADELLARLDGLSRRVVAPQAEQYRSAGAAGSAEDLL